MSPIKIDKTNFQKEVMESDRPVILDFWASWCGPCKMTSPIIDEISNEHPEFKVGKVNIDEEREIASAFHVTSIPTFFLVKDGKVLKKAVGAMSKEMLLEKLK